MSLTFYTSPMSTATVCEQVVAELGIPCEYVQMNLRGGDTKKPEFLAINPNGLVPTIVHDGNVIWESVAITSYLGETFGVDKGLWPAPGAKRAEALKWLVWGHANLAPQVYRWQRAASEQWGAPEKGNEASAKAGLDAIHAGLAVLDAHLAKSEYLAGTFTVADAHLNSFIDWIRHCGVDFAKYEHLKAWGEKCGGRPAAQKVMAEQMAKMQAMQKS